MKNNFSIIQYIILIFNNLFFVLISLELFIKDFNYELDNIFTRMKITKWGLRKNLTIILFTIFLKVIQYLLMIIIICLFDNFVFDTNIVILIMIDIVSVLIIEFLYLTIYLFSIFLSSGNKLFYIIGILIIIILPCNIFELYKLIFQLLVFLIILNTIILVIIKYFHNKIIELIKE